MLKFKQAGTPVKQSAIAMSIMLGVLVLAGCASGKTIPLSSIPGVSAGVIFLHVPDDGGPVILTGNVDRSFDKQLVEKHVRTELGYEEISNRINIP